ncbi:MAG: DNA repair protein RecN, partial [Acidimicrobiia bacterium]|nr:DNA repair protein RecN [Acidimicrobiia bacterium]
RGEGIEDDPARLDEIRRRRQLLRELCRKYGDTLADVVSFHDDASARLAELEGHSERVEQLAQRRVEAHRTLVTEALTVGDARRRAAVGLASSVEQRLRTLAMPDAVVTISVGEREVDPAGDEVSFQLAANPGTAPQALSKVASGGELARAMLALRLVFTDAGGTGEAGETGDARVIGDATSTLVFDEVDAGVGGAAALAVGGALADLGRRHQVLVVTHLAQVASAATQHIVVEKAVAGGVTTATARSLDGDRRVEEVARMLSGSPASSSARAHAAELLARSR